MRMLTSKIVPFSVTIRELKQLRRRPQRRLQKSNRFNDQNNSSVRASRFLVHFFDVHCTTTTWNLLIAVLWRTWTCDDEFSFLFLNLSNSRKSRLHLIFWAGPNRAIKFERRRTHFFTDVFTVVVVVLAAGIRGGGGWGVGILPFQTKTDTVDGAQVLVNGSEG